MDTVNTSSSLRILLVEDDEHDRLTFRRAFEKDHVTCEITECIRAEEALERIRADASSLDVVVIDHKLPGMSGLDLCKVLLGEETPLPLVIITGRGSEQLAIEALKAGVDDYIIKDSGQEYLDLLPVVLPEVVRRYGDRIARKRAEEKLRKTNEELRNFAYVVSHDLKTPIVYIQGFSGLLLENYKEKLDEKGQACVERIQASAHRMEMLVSDLLALSRVGQVVSAFEDVPSNEIVTRVISGLQERLKENGIKLVVADDLPTVCCDRERICQVFENLIVNAIKFMGDTKNPEIKIGYEESAERPDFYEFYVSDNGIGIDPKYHLKIFERFHRLREMEDEEGTGLGLAIVERVVNHHDGRVWVESEKEKGATFYFTLPKAS